MSRALIAGVVAGAIAIVTIAAYAVTEARIESRTESELRQRVAKAQELLIQNASLEGLQILNRAEAVAAEPAYARALTADSDSDAEAIAGRAFRRFRHGLSEDDPRPDILGLTDDRGRVVALYDVARPLPRMWLDDGEIRYAPLRAALARGLISSEVIELRRHGLMKTGVAPVRDGPGGEVLGAVVLGHAVTSSEAQEQRDLLEADVVYTTGDDIHTAAFHEDGRAIPRREHLREALAGEGLIQQARAEGLSDVVRLDLAGEAYMATAGRLPRFSSEARPDDYPAHVGGTVVLDSVERARSAPRAATWSILLVGLGGVVAAIGGVVVTARSFRGPIDELERGIGEILDGNIDRTFRPVGRDFDGLASSLNVMLARLLGRPDPGDDTFEDDASAGRRPVAGGGVQVGAAEMSTKDAEAMALAAEPEPEYYNRLFDEYVKAREEVGESVEDVGYEGFVAKLRLSEASLRKRYEARAVRFRVVVKDGKVILKPVPIV